MGYTTAAKTDVESRVSEEWGGMWFLRDALGTEELALTVLELEPGGRGKEHDHASNEQTEVYYVVEGEVDVDLAGERVTLGPDQAIRLDPGARRQIHNRSDGRVKLILVGGPRGTAD